MTDFHSRPDLAPLPGRSRVATVARMSNDPQTKLEPGPYTTTSTTTFETTPIKITITTEYKSSHVPPPAEPCGCGGGGSLSPDFLQQIVTGIMNMAGSGAPPADDEH